MNIIERALRYSFLRIHIGHLLLIFTLLILPSVWATYHSDDYFHLLLLQGQGILPRSGNGSLWGLFSFIDQLPESRRQMQQYGVLPWFAAEDFYFRFWRPLTEITHWVDLKVFGINPVPAHIHSVIWFLLILIPFNQLVAISFPYKARMTLLASVIFMLDGQHVATIAWIANRSALLATTFSLTALLMHIKWRMYGQMYYVWLAGLSFVLALASAEMAMGVVAYVLMYALIMDDKSIRSRIVSVLPYLLIAAAWMCFYQYQGYGASASAGLYINPWLNPWGYLAAVLQRVPVYMAASLFSFPAGASWVLASWWSYFPLLVVFLSIVMVLVFFVGFRKILSDRVIVFWLSASVLSLIPVCATMAQDRLAILQTVGMDIVIAYVIYQVFINESQVAKYKRNLAVLLVFCHMCVSPLHLFVGSVYLNWAAGNIQKHALMIESNIKNKVMMVMQAPIGEVVTFAGLRQVYGYDLPQQVMWLSNDENRLIVKIESDKSLLVEKPSGFATGFESAFRSSFSPSLDVDKELPVGQVTILPLRKNRQGYIDQIRVSFERSMQSGDVVFYRLDGLGYHKLNVVDLPVIYAN